MKKSLTILVYLLFTTALFSQVGIGTDAPDPSAILHLNANNKGFLPTRVSLTSNTDGTTIPRPATGLIVYNTTNAGIFPNNIIPGLFVNNGTPESPLWRLVDVNVGNGGTSVISHSRRGDGRNGALSISIDNLIFSVGARVGDRNVIVPFVQTTSGTNDIYYSASGVYNGGLVTDFSTTATLSVTTTRTRVAASGWDWTHVGDTQTTFITNSTTGFVYRLTTITAPSTSNMLLTVEKLF